MEFIWGFKVQIRLSLRLQSPTSMNLELEDRAASPLLSPASVPKSILLQLAYYADYAEAHWKS